MSFAPRHLLPRALGICLLAALLPACKSGGEPNMFERMADAVTGNDAKEPTTGPTPPPSQGGSMPTLVEAFGQQAGNRLMDQALDKALDEALDEILGKLGDQNPALRKAYKEYSGLPITDRPNPEALSRFRGTFRQTSYWMDRSFATRAESDETQTEAAALLFELRVTQAERASFQSFGRQLASNPSLEERDRITAERRSFVVGVAVSDRKIRDLTAQEKTLMQAEEVEARAAAMLAVNSNVSLVRAAKKGKDEARELGDDTAGDINALKDGWVLQERMKEHTERSNDAVAEAAALHEAILMVMQQQGVTPLGDSRQQAKEQGTQVIDDWESGNRPG